MTEETQAKKTPKRPAVRETVAKKAKSARAAAHPAVVTQTAKDVGNAAASKATATASAVAGYLPKVELPKVELPKVELPKVELPKVELPKVELPKVELPKFDMPKLEFPQIDTAFLGSLSDRGQKLAHDVKDNVTSAIALVREAVGR